MWEDAHLNELAKIHATCRISPTSCWPDAALRLLSIAEAGPLDQLQRGETELLRAQIAFTMERGSDAPGLLLKAARQLESYDMARARETYVQAISAAMFTGSPAGGVGQLEQA